MAKATTPAKEVTLELHLAGLFASTGPQKSSTDPLPLVLASHGLRGKLNLKYNKSALPIHARDTVKISLHGISCLTSLRISR